MLDLLLAINKIPADKVTIQVTSPATRNTVFVNGQVDSFISVVIGSPLDLVVRAQQGKDKPVYFMPFADFGIAPMGQGIAGARARHRREARRCCGVSCGRARKRSTTSSSRRRPRKPSTLPCGLSGAREERRESVKLQWLETMPRLRTKNTEGHP